jgi:hypothetical protein
MRVPDKLLAVETRLRSALAEIRSELEHSFSVGTRVEAILRRFLRDYLPSSSAAGTGEIIDSAGNATGQVDVVITREYHPYINSPNEPGLYLIEGVACAGEVKTQLTSTELRTTIENCRKYKRLKPSIDRGASVMSNPEDIDRFINHRPFFLFAFESQVTLDFIGQTMAAFYKEHKVDIPEQIDAVFCLDRGSIINFGRGTGTLKYATETAPSVPGLVATRNEARGALIDFMSWLSVCTPRLRLTQSPLVYYLVPEGPMPPRS